MTRLVVESLSVRSFRNLDAVDFEPSKRLNVIAGDNGQGKTSLLEAIYFVATSRSFRTEVARELVQTGAEVCSVRARVLDGSSDREQRAAVRNGRRALAIDGKRPPRASDYAVRTPVVAFHPGDLQLTAGPATGRRLLLDRIALFLDPPSADHRQRYVRALRERQRTLERRGRAAVELDAYEQLLAEHGARWSTARRRASEQLIAALVPAFRGMAAEGLPLDARFVPGGSEDPAELARELRERRDKDRLRGSATFGPQRDELELSIEGRSARKHASQGQQRILTLALKAAELECVRAARDAEPVLLLDDFSSELDPERTGAVYSFLRSGPSQVFVTTTRPELFVSPGAAGEDRADWVVRGGRLAPASGVSDRVD